MRGEKTGQVDNLTEPDAFKYMHGVSIRALGNKAQNFHAREWQATVTGQTSAPKLW